LNFYSFIILDNNADLDVPNSISVGQNTIQTNPQEARISNPGPKHDYYVNFQSNYPVSDPKTRIQVLR
jgi:hypothetical protein